MAARTLQCHIERYAYLILYLWSHLNPSKTPLDSVLRIEALACCCFNAILHSAWKLKTF